MIDFEAPIGCNGQPPWEHFFGLFGLKCFCGEKSFETLNERMLWEANHRADYGDEHAHRVLVEHGVRRAAP